MKITKPELTERKARSTVEAEVMLRGWTIIHPDGRIELDYFYTKNWYNPKIGKKRGRENWRKHFRPDCKIVRATLIIPAV